jgi:LacI family transcriptional regulator
VVSTIRDVAQHAGVSVTTVSHVINDTRYVSDETRRRVEASIAELHYVPSALARGLKNSRTHTIGVMLPNSSNPYFAEIVRGIEDACYEGGYSVILCNSDDMAAKQGRYVRVLMEKQVEGLVVLSSGGDTELGKYLRVASMPQVLVDREVEHLDADLVEVNHEQGGYLATRHLLELGHRQVACIAGPAHLSSAVERLAGWQRALDECGVKQPASLRPEGDFSSASGHSAMLRLMRKPNPPTAVFASNDLMAIGAICAATTLGLRVPQDVSVVGFDDIALAAYASPPLTTVEQPKHQLGELAAHWLLARIADPSMPHRREILEPTLRVRRSSAPPPEPAAARGLR